MRQRPWRVLVGGFGGLLLIMAAAGAGALLFLHSLSTSDAELERHFFARNRTLERIRSSIYLSGTFARDSLLAPEPSGANAQIATLAALRRETEGALEDYAKSLEPEEQEPFRTLRREVDSYWNILDRTFSWTPAERSRNRYAFFYEELVPRRTSMLQIADRVAALNDQAFKRGNDKVSQMVARLQLGVSVMIVVTLLGGALLAGLTIFHILRLENEAALRLDESVRARGSLQELSAKLVRAQEDERRALSRELHDEVGQAFSAILMETENVLDLKPADGVPAHLESIRSLAERGVNEVRNMTLLLRPSMLDDFGLVPALNWQGRETAKRTGLRVHVFAEEMEDLPEEHKTCIYRVVQEALNNAARHAQASAIQVSVKSAPNSIRVSVQDDGSGFDPVRTRGLGMLGMEERVRHLGGTFDIESQPGRGTLVKVELPVASWNGELRSESNSHSAG
ncbi:MAG TPA: sensor histidine kinase [Bryobacteraceae bacterium]|nr:sensor histidine kinase [Bryobacteraceae bacterium]